MNNPFPLVLLPQDQPQPKAAVVLAALIAPATTTVPQNSRPLDDVLILQDGYLGYSRPKEPFTEVARRIEVVALIFDLSAGTRGRLLRFQDVDGTEIKLPVSDADFHQNQAALFGTLAGCGLLVSASAHRGLLLDHLLRQEPKQRLLTSEAGWVSVGNELAFVLPSGTAGPRGVAGHLTVRPGARGAQHAVAGNRGEWRESVGALCRGNSRALLAVSLAFSSTLLPHAGIEGGGVNLVGPSSVGKSTLLVAAKSVFGPPSAITQWRATANALESLAASHNNTLLVMDELGQLDPRSVGATVYMLANGQGKSRSDRTGRARPAARWHLQVLSAGEVGVAEHMAEANQSLKAGQEVRMLDVEAAPVGAHGVFEQLHDFADGVDLSKAIKARCAEVHGWPALEFACFFIDRRDILGTELIPRLKEAAERMVAQVEAEPSALLRRAADRFALAAVAGELATEAGITGWGAGEATWAAQTCFLNWAESRCPDEQDGGDPVELVRSFIAQHQSRFQNVREADLGPVRNRAGWFVPAGNGTGGSDDDEYHFILEVFRTEVLRNLPRNKSLQRLAAAGFLKTCVETGVRRYAPKRRHDHGFERVYVISADIFKGSETDYAMFPPRQRRFTSGSADDSHFPTSH